MGTDGFTDPTGSLGTLDVMTNAQRRMLQWVVLVLAVILTVVAVVNLVTGNGGFLPIIGVICWPIVVAASAYNLVTGGKDGQFTKD